MFHCAIPIGMEPWKRTNTKSQSHVDCNLLPSCKRPKTAATNATPVRSEPPNLLLFYSLQMNRQTIVDQLETRGWAVDNITRICLVMVSICISTLHDVFVLILVIRNHFHLWLFPGGHFMHAIITWLSCTWRPRGCQRKMIIWEFHVCPSSRISAHSLSLNMN